MNQDVHVCVGGFLFLFFFFLRDHLFFYVPFSSVTVFQEFPKTTCWIWCSEYIFFFFLTDIWHENSCEVGIFESKEREVQ